MELAEPKDAIYSRTETPDGIRLIPSELAGGPWDPAHQHGGAVSGLFAHALEEIEAPVPMRIARMTIEMFRGVPLKPLRIEPVVLRAGRRIQSVEARLYDEDVMVARATGLRIRIDDVVSELVSKGARDPELGEPPAGTPERNPRFDLPTIPGFIRAVDIQSELPRECGEPATVWTRLRCRFMADQETSPTVRLATLVDFASGTGNAMDYAKYTSINPDLTIHVLREPRTDWLGIRGLTERAEDGIGQSMASVYDLEGLVARVSASLLLDRR